VLTFPRCDPHAPRNPDASATRHGTPGVVVTPVVRGDAAESCGGDVEGREPGDAVSCYCCEEEGVEEAHGNP